MIRQNEIEEIIRLINKGFDLELLSFELDIPMEQLQEYKKRLELRKFAKESIKNNKIADAMKRLGAFIESTDINVIEKAMLLKLKAYTEKTSVSEDEIQRLEEERKRLGLQSGIDEILEELNVQIPKRKNNSVKRKAKQNLNESQALEEDTKPNYEETIKRYKDEIAANPQSSQGKRNLLAFAYFRAGRIDEARTELMALVEETSNYMAYRQLIYIEKEDKNFTEAKLWAYEALDKFPDSIDIREQLISIARSEKDEAEIIKQLKDIIGIKPENEKHKKMLKSIMKREER